MSAVIARFKSFYAQPYDAKMNAGGWFLFLGFLVLCMVGWRLILSHINIGD